MQRCTRELEEIIIFLTEGGIYVEPNEIDEDYEKGTDPEKFIPAEVNITPRHMTIEIIIDRLAHDEIDLETDFQRSGNLWTEEKQSQLIESLMLKIPLPTF